FPAGGDAGQLEEQFHISENVYAAGMYNAESAGYRQFVSDLEAHEPKADPSDQSAMAWLAVKLFAKVANDAPEVSRSAVLSGLNGLKSFDTDGMTPVLDFTKPNPALGGALPRLFNTTVVPAKLEDHKFVQVESGFVDIFVAPKG
ncbi:MAG TPA: hypothetical protein VKB57_01955, partial [Acidimicrobiales bacterium]|nr:hypothetical protein [Acidimicrobiales bacterium]